MPSPSRSEFIEVIDKLDEEGSPVKYMCFDYSMICQYAVESIVVPYFEIMLAESEDDGRRGRWMGKEYQLSVW